MSNTAKKEITLLLKNLNKGDKSTQDEIMKILYQELRGFAGNILKKENQTFTFQATELVNEAYIRMFDSEKLDWNDRTHFLSTAILVMRRYLVDHARRKKAITRIPKSGIQSYNDDTVTAKSLDSDVVLLDDALKDLENLDVRQAKIVELRFFGGLTEKEVSNIMNISVSTVNREWKAAKLWLTHQIRSN